MQRNLLEDQSMSLSPQVCANGAASFKTESWLEENTEARKNEGGRRLMTRQDKRKATSLAAPVKVRMKGERYVADDDVAWLLLRSRVHLRR